MILEQITQPEAIKDLILKDELYKNILGLDSLDNFSPDLVHSVWFKVIENNNLIGIALITPFCANCITFHGGIYKEHRGQFSGARLQICLDYIKSLYPKYVILMPVNSSNIPAQKLVAKSKFKLKTKIINGCGKDHLFIYAER